MVLTRDETAEKDKQEEVKFYKEAFDYYDWSRNGKVPVKVRYTYRLDINYLFNHI